MNDKPIGSIGILTLAALTALGSLAYIIREGAIDNQRIEKAQIENAQARTKDFQIERGYNTITTNFSYEDQRTKKFKAQCVWQRDLNDILKKEYNFYLTSTKKNGKEDPSMEHACQLIYNPNGSPNNAKQNIYRRITGQ